MYVLHACIGHRSPTLVELILLGLDVKGSEHDMDVVLGLKLVHALSTGLSCTSGRIEFVPFLCDDSGLSGNYD